MDEFTYTHPAFGDFSAYHGKLCKVIFKWGAQQCERTGQIDAEYDELKLGINDEPDGTGRWFNVRREHVLDIELVQEVAVTAPGTEPGQSYSA